MSELRGRGPHCDGYYCDNLGGCPKAPAAQVSESKPEYRNCYGGTAKIEPKKGTGIGFYGGPMQVDMSKSRYDLSAYVVLGDRPPDDCNGRAWVSSDNGRTWYRSPGKEST